MEKSGTKDSKTEEKADIFYETKLMKLIEEEFVENNKSKVREKVDYLIMSVGTSCEPLILDIQLLKPERIHFLYTEETECILEKIVKHCQLDVMRYSKHEVHGTEPLDIYREIKDAYLKWDRPDKMYIDFTGGTKAMSAAAAMAEEQSSTYSWSISGQSTILLISGNRNQAQRRCILYPIRWKSSEIWR